MTTTPAPTRLDQREAQTAATMLVAQALSNLNHAGKGVTIHGEHYTIHGPVRAECRPGQLDGLIGFTVADGTTEEAVFVTLMVAAAPGGAR